MEPSGQPSKIISNGLAFQMVGIQFELRFTGRYSQDLIQPSRIPDVAITPLIHKKINSFSVEKLWKSYTVQPSLSICPHICFISSQNICPA